MINKKSKHAIFGVMTAALMGATVLAPHGGGILAALAEDEEELTVKIEKLEVNGSENPLGIDDEKPIFSWQLSSDERGKSQTAYRIVVKNGGQTVWDSQKVTSENNYGVVYNGPSLQSKTAYEYTVTVWDNDDETVTAESWFETGLMSESDWTSSWIGEPALQTAMSFSGSNWIWDRQGHAVNEVPGETAYFRRDIQIDPSKTVERVQIAMSADDRAKLYLNGAETLSTLEITDAWKTAAVTTLDASAFVAGKNVIAVEATNTDDPTGYAGLLCKIEIYYNGSNTPVTIVTDGEWKTSDTNPNGWNTVSFDDSGWHTPTGDDIISYGSAPWNNNVSISATSGSAPVLRKEFSTASGKTIRSARAYIAGLGLYELKINGNNATDSVLNPANTDYNDTVLYDVYDVTNLIASGDNAIAVELGNGFYNENITGWGWNTAPWRNAPRLRFELDVTYTDGTKEQVRSDASWKYSVDGPTTRNSIYSGETFDARRAADFSNAEYSDAAWRNAGIVSAPNGKLVWQDMEQMTKTASFGKVDGAEGVLDISYSASLGKWTVKTPRNIAGWARIAFRNTTPGQKITIDYAETLASDGNLNLKTESDGVTQRDEYICKGVSGSDTEVYEPKFNYKGVNYVQISGYSGTLTADDVVCYQINSNVAHTSTFSTSNEMLNTMHDLMTRTLLNNFHGKPTDTPWLEKNGWMGDVNIAIETMGFDFDIARFMTKFLNDIKDSQTSNGNVPQLVPNSGTANMSNAPVWNTVYIFAVKELVDTYGMSYLIDEYYDSMKKLAELDIDTLNNGIWPDQYLLGDWSSPVSTPGNGEVPYDEEPVDGGAFAATAYIYQMLGVMTEYAQALKKPLDAAKFTLARTTVLNAFNARYYKDGYYETTEWANNHAHDRTKYRQTSQILPLAFGMVKNENIDAVVSRLVKDIKDKDYHLDTGIIGTKYILPILCDYGYEDVAYRIVTQTTYPSWGYWLEKGATSLWEMWESTSRSQNHYFLGTYDQWFFEYIGGIKNVTDGYKTFDIDPLLAGDLENADISLDTVRGKLEVKWAFVADNKAKFDITIPFGSTVKLVLPTASVSGVTLDGAAFADTAAGVISVGTRDGKAEITLGSGSYSFVSPLDKRAGYKGALDQAIEYAEKLSQADYKAEGWTVFASALETAKTVQADQTATQSQINSATNGLESAIAALNDHINANRVALKARVNEIISSGVMNLSYTTGAVSAFQTALSKASVASRNESLTEAQIKEELDTFEAAIQTLLYSCRSNLSRISAAKVSASSSVNAENDKWGSSFLTDGDTTGIGGWSSLNLTDQQHEEWVLVDLGFDFMIDRMVIYTRGGSGTDVAYGMPRDFVIEVSKDGVSYEPVVTETDYQPRAVGAHEFSFDSVKARYVRVRGTKLNQLPYDGNTYRMQLAELEIYNSPRADLSAIDSLMDRYDALDRSLYTTDSLLELEAVVEKVIALYDRTVYATEQSEVNKLVAQFESALDDLVLKNPSNSGTNPPDNTGNEEKDPPAEQPDGSVNVGAIVGGVLGGVAAVGAGAAVAVVLVKRKKSGAKPDDNAEKQNDSNE
ncbi:MAG: family 78 glycoside hydrolase catalytic domain [Clostridiales bacterium]|nr:family 78 glycoside hydrolase catalytic domain [Clostridiales bacterium]